MLTSLIGFYLSQALEPMLALNENDLIPPLQIVESASVNIHKLDLSSLLSVSPIPVKREAFVAPIIEAYSSISMDVKTGEILFEKNSNTKRQIASITKLMTAIVILEENDLTDIVKVDQQASQTTGSHMFLRTDEEITVENLMYGLMIQSANDAAVALAEFNAGSVESFVEKMNKKALELGLINTHFQNPIGFDHKDNYSTALDIAKLARYAYRKEFIKEAASTSTMKVMSVDKAQTHELETTNELLDSYLHIKGLKTGSTEKAGLCNVAIAEDEDQNEIIAIVLHSPDRFRESKILIDWIFRAYIW